MASKQIDNSERRFKLWHILLGLACVALTYGAWETLLRPRYLFDRAVASLDQDPLQAAQLSEEAFATSMVPFPRAQLLWTRALLKSGRWDEAVGCYSLIEAPGQLPSVELIQLGDESMQAGFPMLATFAFEAVPPQSLDYVQAIDGLIQVRGAEQNWPQVAELSNKVESNKLAIESQFLIAVGFESQLKFQAAESFYQRVAESESASAELKEKASRALTRIALRLGERSKADKWISQCHARSTNDWELQLMQARLLRLQGNRDAAMKAVDALLASSPNHTEANLLRGSLSLEAGLAADAAVRLQRVIDNNPYSKEGHYKLALALRQLGQPAQAKLHFAENRELNEASLTILELQGKPSKDITKSERTKRLAEAYERLGQHEIANQIRSSSF